MFDPSCFLDQEPELHAPTWAIWIAMIAGVVLQAAFWIWLGYGFGVMS